MYGRKVGFALDLPTHRRDEDRLYSPERAQRGHDDDVSCTSHVSEVSQVEKDTICNHLYVESKTKTHSYRQ